MAARPVVPDKGWSWMVLFASFLSNVILDGIIFTFGVFYVEFLTYFNRGHSLTSWIGSVISAVYGLVGPLASLLANRFGCRYVTIGGTVLTAAGFILCIFSPDVWAMILTYGIMGGIGFGLVYQCSYVMIGYYFEKRRSLAIGIVSCGSGIGTFVFAPLTTVLIMHFGWRGAMLILTGIVLNCMVFGLIFRPVPALEKKQGEGLKSLLDVSLFKDPTFLLFGLSSFICLIGFFVPFIFLIDLIEQRGLADRQTAAISLSILGAVNTVGRVICGLISDQPWADPLKIYIGGLMVGGIATAAVAWMNTFWLLCIYAAVFGACIACYVSLCAIILVELMGLDKLSNAFGFVNMFRGLATLIGPPLAGFLHDTTGDYDLAFYVAGASIFISGAICIPLRLMGRCPCVKTPEEETPEPEAEMKALNEVPA